MEETLVIASKVKKYIKEKGGMNTSASTVDALSNLVRRACEEAIAKARDDKRKTVMDRDVG